MQEKQRNGWVVLTALYYYSVVAAFNLLKAPPLFGLLMESFNLSENSVGIIVSASSIAGLAMVFPSAFIARRLGTRRTGQLAICLSVTGCLLGAFAPNLPILLVARFIEGCGLGVTGVVGSTTLPQYFKGKKLGLPMAIWSTWFFVGSALGSLLSGRVGHYFENWRASWLLGAGMAIIGFVVFSLFVFENKSGSHAPVPTAQPLPETKKESFFGLGIKNLRIWCIGIFFATLLASLVGFLSFGTEYFSTVFGMEKADASAFASLGYWFSVVGSVAAGIVSRVRKGNSLSGQFVQLLICAALCLVVYPFGFQIPQQFMLLYLAIAGLLNGYTCGVVFGTVPRLVRAPQSTGVSMGIIFVCQNISSFSASLLVGACVDGGNWDGAMLPLFGVACVGLIFAIGAAVFSLRKKKKMQQVALPTKEEFDALKSEVEQLKQELETSAVSLQTAREEKDALQRDCIQTQEALTALQSEVDDLRKAAEQAQADLVKTQAESAQYLQDTKLAVERELAAQRELQELKHQLNVLKRMSPLKRMLWKG